MLAFTVAVGAFAVASAFAPDDASAEALAATLPTSHTLDTIAPPTSLSGTPRVTTADASATRALSVVPVREQAFDLSRAETPVAPTSTPITAPTSVATPDEVVRAARVVTPTAAATQGLAVGDRVRATVSFYYCNVGAGLQGDGGGFCGRMRDGSVVYSGAAACDYQYLGQRFRIQGDPLNRIYRCADTGSAVHGLHRDIWFASNEEGWAWVRAVGPNATIEIVP